MNDEVVKDSDPVAAVDLGSNSFHLIIGREVGGQLSVIDRLRDPVRMAEGLDESGKLSEKKLSMMLESLERMGQRLRDIPAGRKRAIGTNAFRRAKKPDDLLARSSAALGIPIEVLSGAEEARLIYLGVSHDQPESQGRRLVIDIGGGSTECIVGEGFTPRLLESFYMGCVSYSMQYFPGGETTKKAFRKAEVAAKLEIGTVVRRFRSEGWATCVGSSGSINAIATILRELGQTDGSITLPALKFIRRTIIAAGSMDEVDLPGLTPERRPVLPGGLAILKGLFESMDIETMSSSNAALREGLLYDLVGRIRHEDVRDRTIRSLSERYSIDAGQAERVEKTALACLEQVAKTWKIDHEDAEQLLSWAARMHEIGLSVSYHGSHRHGGYILTNSTMPGFSRQEQRRLATLVQSHRRKLNLETFDDPVAEWKQALIRLSMLLRLAVRLNRSRSTAPRPEFTLVANKDELEIGFPGGWLEDHPLTRADLEEEGRLLKAAGLGLRVNKD